MARVGDSRRGQPVLFEQGADPVEEAWRQQRSFEVQHHAELCPQAQGEGLGQGGNRLVTRAIPDRSQFLSSQVGERGVNATIP